MNVAYDLEFDLDSFLSTLDKGRSARQRVEDYQEARRLRRETAGLEEIEE